MEHVEILGVTITPADCFLSDATESTLKILQMFGRTDIPVALGRPNICGKECGYQGLALNGIKRLKSSTTRIYQSKHKVLLQCAFPTGTRSN